MSKWMDRKVSVFGGKAPSLHGVVKVLTPHLKEYLNESLSHINFIEPNKWVPHFDHQLGEQTHLANAYLVNQFVKSAKRIGKSIEPNDLLNQMVFC